MRNLTVKRILAAFAAGVLCLAAAGCGADGDTHTAVSVNRGTAADENPSSSVPGFSADTPENEGKSDPSGAAAPSEKSTVPKTEITIEAGSSGPENESKASSPAENTKQENTETAGNGEAADLWDSDGDGYYDIKIH